MRQFPTSILAAALLALQPLTAFAAAITFATNPLTGNAALTTPGRQIVGGEPSITFNPATDTLVIDPAAFGVGALQFANGFASALPTTGVNFAVLQNGAPLAAGSAADAIAARVTATGAGFFIYFNSALDLPRLVYSTNLDDNTADLAILARFTNLTGAAGFATLSQITAANVRFASVPEPGTLGLLGTGLLLVTAQRRRRAG